MQLEEKIYQQIKLHIHIHITSNRIETNRDGNIYTTTTTTAKKNKEKGGRKKVNSSPKR